MKVRMREEADERMTFQRSVTWGSSPREGN